MNKDKDYSLGRAVWGIIRPIAKTSLLVGAMSSIVSAALITLGSFNFLGVLFCITIAFVCLGLFSHMCTMDRKRGRSQ